MNEELRKILDMVEEGVITAEEAAKLLNAMNLDDSSKGSTTHQELKTIKAAPKKVRILVTEEGMIRVNMSIPFSLLRMGLRLGAAAGAIGFNQARNEEEAEILDILKSIDVDELMSALAEDDVVLPYIIVDVDADGKQVQVFLE